MGAASGIGCPIFACLAKDGQNEPNETKSAPQTLKSAQTGVESAQTTFKSAQTVFKSAQIDHKSAQKTITPMFSTNLFKCAELKMWDLECSGL